MRFGTVTSVAVIVVRYWWTRIFFWYRTRRLWWVLCNDAHIHSQQIYYYNERAFFSTQLLLYYVIYVSYKCLCAYNMCIIFTSETEYEKIIYFNRIWEYEDHNANRIRITNCDAKLVTHVMLHIIIYYIILYTSWIFLSLEYLCITTIRLPISIYNVLPKNILDLRD